MGNGIATKNVMKIQSYTHSGKNKGGFGKIEYIKRCIHCGKTKLIEEFYSKRNTWDKLYGNCKECGKKYTKKMALTERGKN